MRVNRLFLEQLIDHRAQHFVQLLFARQLLRQVRDDDLHAALARAHVEAHGPIREDRLFDEEDAALTGEAAQ
jgi:hypothetical protein